MSKSTAPKPGTKGLMLDVLPSKTALNEAIAANGKCNPTECYHFVAINQVMDALAPDERHHIRLDAGHIKMNYRGWRYVADTPRYVKRSLMLFDLERYGELRIRSYRLRFRRTTKIIATSEKRKQQINEARRKRLAAGSDEAQRDYSGLRKRIEGFSGIV